MFKVIVCTLFAILHSARSADPDIYWRPFTGTIPDDAVPAAADFGFTAYVGIAPYQDRGLFVGEALPGISSIDVTVPNLIGGGSHSVNQHMKILCSSKPDNFKWVAATYSTLHSIPGVVEGGYENANVGTLYVGRAFVNNQMRIGKVVSYHVGDGREEQNILYVTNGADEVAIDNFQLLTYSES